MPIGWRHYATGGVLLLTISSLMACGSSDKAAATQPVSAITSAPTAGSGSPAVATTSAPTTAPKETAGDAVKRNLDQLSKGQFGPEWDELHPAQQALVPRDLFIQCGGKAGFPTIDNVKVVTTYTETVAVPGTSERGDSTAVTVSMTLHSGLAKERPDKNVSRVRRERAVALGARRPLRVRRREVPLKSQTPM